MEHTIQISFIYDGNSHHTSCSSSVVPQLTAAVKDIASEIVKNYLAEFTRPEYPVLSRNKAA